MEQNPDAKKKRKAYKVVADITFWMVALLVARFMKTIIPRHRELHKKV